MKKTNTHCRTHLHNNFSSQAHCRRAVWFEMLLACLAWTPPHPGGPGATLGPTELPGAHSWWSSFTSWHIWDPSIIHTPGRWSIGVSHHGGTVGVGGGARVLLPRFRITAECEFVRLCALVISGWHLMLTRGYVTYQMIPAHHQTVSYTHAGRMAGRFFMHNLQENTDMA